MNKNFGPLIEVYDQDDDDFLHFYSQDSAMDQLQRFIEQHQFEYCHEYGEPGYDLGDKRIVVLGDYWCRCKNNPFAGRPKGYGYDRDELVKPEDLHSYDAHFPMLWKRWEQIAEFEWCDEWMIDYENDKCYRTTGDSYSWQPSVIYTEYGDPLTPDDDIDTWVEWAAEHPTERIIPRHIYDKSDLEAIGFSEWNGVYENGWHPGQTDDPKAIVKEIRDQLGDDTEIVFSFTEASQFYIRFEAMIRQPQYAVIWASAGCLPDSEEPAFVGSMKECEEYIETDPDGYTDNLSEHNLYSFDIIEWENDDDDA